MATTVVRSAGSRRRWSDASTRTRFIRLLRKFSGSAVGRKARWLFAVLLFLLVAINGLNVVNSYVGRDFMTALEKRATAAFVRQALLYVGVFALSTLAIVYLRFTEETLALTWREWLSREAVRRYLRPPIYYRLSDRLVANGEVANPDQRISDDVRTFTTTTLSFMILLLNGTFTIIAFSGVMWSISPPLFFVTIVYAAVGSLLAIAWGRPLVKLNVSQLDKEADFRAELIHVRENAEALAIARREGLLKVRLLRRIDDLAANFRRVIRVNRNLGLFATGYNYLIQIIPALVVAPLFIRGDVEFGVVTQSAMAFAQLVGAFSLIITQFQSISSYAAVVTRLGVLEEGIEQAQARPELPVRVCPHEALRENCPLCPAQPLPTSGIQSLSSGAVNEVLFDRLTLLSPSDGRVLMRDFSGSVTPDSRLLIQGPNEEAKSALFRATAGTWSSGSGRLVRPGDNRLLFLAERPYLPPGTLREVLSTAGKDPPVSDQTLVSTLRELNLESLVARIGGLDLAKRWDNVLSLGEQKLVAFARILLTVPRFVFLERPGVALSTEQLRRILDLLAEKSISVLTIGLAEDAPGYYNARLELGEDGGWQWIPLPRR
jgi:putative ATP-binding cassette transporter